MSSKDGAASDGGPWDKQTSEKFENKRLSEFYDPCQEAADRSLKCLHRNGGEKTLCADYFQKLGLVFLDYELWNYGRGEPRVLTGDCIRAYRDCKKQWIADRKEAKRQAGKSWFS